ncbi:hypothetical protein WA1_15600 [Scytonema hofmannii PCC 7110]|uniref:Uncharacterized protein n=1 Tax=Scytonema hofmannii PCC 7110 TaxID=128403 RepID=A0A139X9W0_9CYAN|nr:hypothetical protein WA1_15600 [Scytonema hofmannii PCC 7110]
MKNFWRCDRGIKNICPLSFIIPFWILDFGFWIGKVLLILDFNQLSSHSFLYLVLFLICLRFFPNPQSQILSPNPKSKI